MRRRSPKLAAAPIGAMVLVLVSAVAACAASAVFAGDPVDPSTGVPYEILPGQPLVTAGPDGRLGTADDVVDRTIVGDIDLVVRLGDVSSGAAIPDPASMRGGLATGTVGLGAQAVAIPFHVYLSDGAVGVGRPYGNLLAASDMVGLPVIVTLFADRDADGFIGPTGKDPGHDVRALAELVPVGTEVALFDASGRADGTIVASVGGPPSRGGVALVATASAFTGAYDPQVLNGSVPTGPGITTAQPFLPERDPARLFTDVGPLQPAGTLNPRPRAAAIPDPESVLSLALGTKRVDPTTDAARAVAGPAVCARLVEPRRGRGLPSEPPAVTLGTVGSAAHTKLALVAVDRFGNPTDPAPGMVARLTTDAPLGLMPDKDGVPAAETIALAKTTGVKVAVQASSGGAGTLRVLVAGALCQSLPVSVRAERNRGASDAVVALHGRADYRRIADAAAGAVDRNGDGRITITVADGVFRERVTVTRDVAIVGAGVGRSIVDAEGLGSALTLAASGATIEGITASGGTAGVTVAMPMNAVGLDARDNVGTGIALTVPGAAATACVARDNGGAGISLAGSTSAVGNTIVGNAGAGVATTTGAANVTVSANVLSENHLDGVRVTTGTDPVVTGNAIAGNYGAGIDLDQATGGTIAANRVSANDDDGLVLNKSTGALIDGNDFSGNHGFGMRIDRSTADFDAAVGTQAPPGTNDVSGNRKGDLQIK